MSRAAILTRETEHLSQVERDTIARRLTLAADLVTAFPRADEQALTIKLLSFGSVPRWACSLIARAALESRPAAPAAIAA